LPADYLSSQQHLINFPLSFNSSILPLDLQPDDESLAAMAALIDEGEDDVSLADHWKGKGNESVVNAQKEKSNKRLGYYKHALAHYDTALKHIRDAVQPPNRVTKKVHKLHSTILGNQAQVHLALKNYGSCRKNCVKAVAVYRKNVKAYYRAAKASFEVKKYREGRTFAEYGLKHDPENKPLVQIMAKLQKKCEELDAKEKAQKKAEQQLDFKVSKCMKACKERGITVGPAQFIERYMDYEAMPEILPDGSMSWPVVFLYDEYQQSDFMQAFHEGEMFAEHLAMMLPIEGPPAPWDEHFTYKASDVDVFFQESAVMPFDTQNAWRRYFAKKEGVTVGDDAFDADETPEERRKRYEFEGKEKPWVQVPVMHGATLLQTMQHNKFVVPALPIFYIFARQSDFYAQWKKGKKIRQLTSVPAACLPVVAVD
jgi:tetratricopeptide (TPR) repeat protein